MRTATGTVRGVAPWTELESKLEAATAELAAATEDADLEAAVRRAVAGGARVRPRLLLAAHDAWASATEPDDAVWTAAVAHELLHAAFVVHDDVIDDDWERRGEPNPQALLRDAAHRVGIAPSAARERGRAGAIIVGDLLLHEATMRIGSLSADRVGYDVAVAMFTRAVRTTATGEWWDVSATSATPTQRVSRTTRDKTALYTFAGPLVSGAALGGATAAQCEAIERIGTLLGTAYQMCDDLIGAFGSRDEAGRVEGVDLRAGRMTSLIDAARGADEWPRLQSLLDRDGREQHVEEMRSLLRRSGAADALRVRIGALLTDAETLAARAVSPLIPIVTASARSLEERMPGE